MRSNLVRGLAFAGLFASLGGGMAFGQTQSFVKPGDEGTIEFPMENDSTSGLDAAGVNLTVRVEPSSMADRIQINSLTVQEGGSLPTDIAKGQTRTAVVSYTIASAAQDGDSFQVSLDADIPDQVVIADPSTWGVVTRFIIDSRPPIVTVADLDTVNRPRESGPYEGPAGLTDPPVWFHGGADGEHASHVVFKSSDLGGISLLKIENPTATEFLSAEVRVTDFYVGLTSITLDARSLPDAPGYLLTSIDRAANATTRFFGVDSRKPLVDYHMNVTIGLSSRLHATGRDDVSGMDSLRIIDSAALPDFHALFPGGLGIRPQFSSIDSEIPLPPLNPEIFDSVTHAQAYLVAGDASGLSDLYGGITLVGYHSGGTLDVAASGNAGYLPLATAGSWGNRLVKLEPSFVCMSRECLGGLMAPGCHSGFADQTCGSVEIWAKAGQITHDPGLGNELPAEVLFETHSASGELRVWDGEVFGPPIEPTTVTVGFTLGYALGPHAQLSLKVFESGDPLYTPLGDFKFVLDALNGRATRQVALVPVSSETAMTATLDGLTVSFDDAAQDRVHLLNVTRVDAPPPAGYGPAPGSKAVAIEPCPGPITIALTYDPAQLDPDKADKVDVFTLASPGGVWEKITTSRVPGKVTGKTSHCSLFGLFVAEGDVFNGGLALGQDGAGNIWELAREDAVFRLTKYAQGVAAGALALPDAVDAGGRWSLRFDAAGNAYAVGTSTRPLGAGAGVAVYKVSPAMTLLSSAAFNMGLNGQSIAFDASGDVWIAGATLEGSAEASGPLMALWRYCFHDGSLKLKASYTRHGGLDYGTGVRVVGSEVWVAGYSMAPSTPAFQGSLDLALWRFDAAGRPTGGPFLTPGLGAGGEGLAQAALEASSGSLYVAAGRPGEGGSDLAFLKFDRSGRLLSERAWSSASGTSDYPTAITLDGQGRVLVAGASGGSAALWRYDDGGGLVSALAVPTQNLPMGVIAQGPQTWLALRNSALPYLVEGAAALPGSDVLISSQAPAGDTAAPVTTAFVGSPSFISADSATYVTPQTPITFTAQDDDSGVARIEISVDEAAFSTYASTLTLAEGRHMILYRAVDNAGNVEDAKTLALRSDNTPPQTTASFASTKLFGLDIIAPQSQITLSASDPVSNEVAGGVAGITYRVDGGPITSYGGPFNLPAGTHVIDYGASDNVGNAEARKTLAVAVSNHQEAAVSGVDGVNATGSAQVAGLIQSNGKVNLSGNAQVQGDVTASQVVLAGNASVSGTVTQGQTPLLAEPIDLALLTRLATSAVQGIIPAEFLSAGRLVVGSNKSLTLSAGVYVVKGLLVSAGGALQADGAVQILVEGAIQVLGGGSIQNASVVSNSPEAVFLAGGAQLSGSLYAPKAALELQGNAQFQGHAFAKSANIAGNVSLGSALASNSKLKTAELQAPTVSESFGFRSLVVFPNPARGGQHTTIRARVGLADSVSFAIYGMKGDRVDGGVATSPKVVDLGDGRGPQYVYDFIWDTSRVPPGVYHVAATARKGGETISKSAKAAVLP